MSLIELSGVGFGFGGEVILEEASAALYSGNCAGLVGPNGAGKTTLLRLLAGEIDPDQGRVQRQRGLRSAYCTQAQAGSDAASVWEFVLGQTAGGAGHRAGHPDAAAVGHATASEPLAITVEAKRMLTGLGLGQAFWDAPLGCLSGGQRQKAALARALITDADLYLFDEPANHLDLEAQEFLAARLKGLASAGGGRAIVLASHDRWLLDACATQIWELEGGRLYSYPGNYSKSVSLRQARREKMAEEYIRQQEYIARTEEYIRRNIAGQNTRQAQGRRTLLARMERVSAVQADPALSLVLKPASPSGEQVLLAEGLGFGFAPAKGHKEAPALDGGAGHRARLPVSTDDFQSYTRRLPHWRLSGSVYFVTWRLHPNHKALTDEARTIVADQLLHFHAHRYDLFGYVVMDDHVHVLVRPYEGHSLQSILHGWKSYTANRLQRECGMHGKVWQDEYFDRIIRDEAELNEKAGYMANNPRKRWFPADGYKWAGFWASGFSGKTGNEFYNPLSGRQWVVNEDGGRGGPPHQSVSGGPPLPGGGARLALNPPVISAQPAAAPARLLFAGLDLQLHKGERLGISGPNGCGKTTLLRLLARRYEPGAGVLAWGANVRPGFFAQDSADLPRGVDMLGALRAGGALATDGELRSFLARFGFSGDDVYKECQSLSGGERSRLSLARIFWQRPNLLLLDEPDNHLDIYAREALEQFLAAYEGTVVLVTHDRALLEGVCDRILAFEPAAGGGFRTAYFRGGYVDYLKWRDRPAGEPVTGASSRRTEPRSPGAGALTPPPGQRIPGAEELAALAREAQMSVSAYCAKQAEKQRRRMAELESLIGAAEGQAAALKAEQRERDRFGDYNAITRLQMEIDPLERLVDGLLEELERCDQAAGAWEGAAAD